MITNFDNLTLPLKPEIHLYDFGDTGFGDVLNYMSYIYTHAKTSTIVKWFRSEYQYDSVRVIRDFVLQPCQLVTHIKRPHVYEHWSKNKYNLYNHEYWPCRVQKSAVRTNIVAINFYTKRTNHWNNHYKVTSNEFSNITKSQILKSDYDYATIYHLNNSRGSELIIENSDELIQKNLGILQNVDAYIGIESGIGHICRSMKIPCLFYHDPGSIYDNVVAPLMNEQQIIFNDKQQFLEYIPIFLKSLE